MDYGTTLLFFFKIPSNVISETPPKTSLTFNESKGKLSFFSRDTKNLLSF